MSSRAKPYIDRLSQSKFPDEKPRDGGSTAHKTEAEYVEHFDDKKTFRKKCKTLANWIRESEHMIAFTGAGVSTSTGVPDSVWFEHCSGYRSWCVDVASGRSSTESSFETSGYIECDPFAYSHVARSIATGRHPEVSD